MNTVEQTLWQWCPIPSSRVAQYTLFMTAGGAVPFTPKDLQGIWDEWRQSDLATHAVAGTQIPHPLQQYGAPAAVGYNPQWVTEREKFYNLFRGFVALNQGKTTGSLFLIYPDGQEIQWTPTSVNPLRSNRGPQLAQIMKALKLPGDLGLAVTVQYTYNDNATTYTTPATRSLDNGYEAAVVEAIKRAALDTTPNPPLLPTLTDEPVPLNALRDFWTVFRTNNASLKSRYGAGSDQVSGDFNRFRGLYDNQQTGIQAFFQHLAELDTQVPMDKLLMANFIYDAGFQYALVRLTPQLAQIGGKSDHWDWIKLPSTPGTQYIASMAPVHVRMVVKGFYIEK